MLISLFLNENLLFRILEHSNNVSELEWDNLFKIIELDYDQLITILGKQGYFKDENNKIKLDSKFRINLAIYGIVNLNLQPFEVIKYLTWQEFEEFCLYVLEQYDFKNFKNFRFSKQKSRFEIDILSFHQPYILCIDAKRWKIGYGKISALKQAAEKQISRVEAFYNVLFKFIDQFQISSWKYASLVPIIITSMDEGIKSYKEVPIVPFFQFNDFITDLYKFIEELPQFKVKIKKHGAQSKLLF